MKFEVPWVRAREKEEKTLVGAGDAVAGVKWRFLGREGTRIAWSIYPQFEVNTVHSSVAKGIVEEGHQLLVPTEFTVEFVHGEINGEVGRTFVEGRPDHWIFAMSTESHVGSRLELLAELHDEQIHGNAAELFANIGARPKLTRQMILLLAAGRTVHDPLDERPRVYVYAGLQVNVPGQYSFTNADRTGAWVHHLAR